VVESIVLSERPFTYISNAVVKRLITVEDSIGIAEQTLRDHYNGDITWSSPRLTTLEPPGCSTSFKFKGGSNRRLGIAGFRLFSDNRSEAAIAIAGSRPTKHVLLSDYTTGEVFAIVDEHWSHALRTGSCAAVAAKHLMVPGTTEAAVVGTGYMAYCCVHSLNSVMRLDRLKVWSRDSARLENFVRRIRHELGITVEVAPSAQRCVADMKVVITVTNAPSPFLKKEWFAPGVFIYAMGNHQEVDLETYLSMSFFADEREQVKVCPDIFALMQSGALPMNHVHADLGEVVGDPRNGRTSLDQQIIVRSQGLASQDIAQAYWIYNKALESGSGADLEPYLVEQAGSPLF
jgi:ornithine cyclodeaminase/alanine dehydrogenase-like protein (mu-crystallin family)